MDNKTQNTPEKALYLHQLGLSPTLAGKRGDDLKRPILKNWQVATYTPEALAAWPRSHNVGIRAGRQPNGRYLVVFDFDYDAARIFPTWQKKAAGIIKRPLVVVASGKGFHVYLFTPDEKRATTLAGEYAINEQGKQYTRKFIETIAARKQVITAGSLHPSGKAYQFAPGSAGYDAIPTITQEQYDALVKLSAQFDIRPPRPKVQQVRPSHVAGSGELAHITDCLAYAREFLGGEEKPQRNGDIKFDGHGGFFVKEDGSGWFSFSDDTGGGLAALIAWHRGIDLPAALAMLRPASNFVLYPGKHSLTIELRAGEFLGNVDVKLPRRAYLKAQTGVGKTTWAVTISDRVVLVVPTQALLEQLCSIHHQATPFYQYAREIVGSPRLIITTPDSLGKLLLHIDASVYSLVIDEAHLIHTEGYRKRAYDQVVRTLNGDWRQVILMSGTPLPTITQNLEIFESVAVKAPAREQKAHRVTWKDEEGNGDLLATAVSLMPSPASGRRSFLYLNDKGKGLDALIFELRRAGYDPEHIGVINADRRDSREYRALVETEGLPEDIRVLVATAVISTGFNIRDEFDTVLLLSSVSSAEAQQIVNRLRTAAAGVVYWFNNGDGDRCTGNLDGIAAKIAHHAQTIANELNHQLGTGDVYEAEFHQKRLKTAARLDNAQLVTLVDDPLTGSHYYEVSAVGCCNALYRLLLATENNNPELFKANTIRYGWVWDEDIHRVRAAEKPARRAYQAEKQAERLVWHEQQVFQLLAWGHVDTVTHLRQSHLMDRDTLGLAKTAVSLTDKLGIVWQASCTAVLYGMGQTRRMNDIKRRLMIQATRQENPVTLALYAHFEIGERLTNEEARARLLSLFGRDRVLAAFCRPRYDGDDPVTTNKAIAILGDYFHLKRCKIAMPDGTRVNGYEIADDCPHATLRDPLEGPEIRLDSLLPSPVSQLTHNHHEPIVGQQQETATPVGIDDPLAALFMPSDAIRRQMVLSGRP